MSNYPAGTEHHPRAPWNEPSFDEVEFELEVFVTIKKKVKITLEDYYGERDVSKFDYSELLNAAKDQHVIKFSGWDIEDIEVDI